MPEPAEQPYYYPDMHTGGPEDLLGRSSRHPDWRFRRTIFIFSTLFLLGALFMVGIIYLNRFGPSALPAADASATSEAITFATAQAERSATRASVNATAIVAARMTTVAQGQETATAEVYLYRTATAAAFATAQAPPTLTAQAQEFAADQASAEATAQAMDSAATMVYGPASGTLDHGSGKHAICLSTGLQLHNFIAQAAFYNPYPTAQHAWDYGFAFTNIGDDNQYTVSVDSGPHWAVALRDPGYYIQESDTISMLGLGDFDFNFVKLYVQDEVVHLFVNGQYVTTVALSNLDLANNLRPALHEPQACAGVEDDDLQQGASTRYEDFTVWSTP